MGKLACWGVGTQGGRLTYFTFNPKLRFLGFAGLGRHGGALLLEEKDELGVALRKLVVKYSLGELSNDIYRNSDDDLRNEHGWLSMLRGSEHIVKLVDLADTSIALPGVSNGEDDEVDTFAGSFMGLLMGAAGVSPPPVAAPAPPPAPTGPQRPRRKCPTFALEYLEGGTLRNFQERAANAGTWIPNRLLWKIWLCMVRQCVAMAYPPNIPDDSYHGQEHRERIIPDEQIYGLTQNSGHLDNFLFGSQSSQLDIEHGAVPILKLIDFGRGRVEDPDPELAEPYEYGSKANLWSAAYAMSDVCCLFGEEDEVLQTDPPELYFFQVNGRYHSVLSDAPKALTEHVYIDLVLRDMLVRCMANDMDEIPALHLVLQATEESVAARGPYDNLALANSMQVEETDAYIRQFVQNFIFNP
ncbi:hypothetical protein F5Y19DRAFT_471148 [Xylariaceae sp. FL1651]|nr:hypothetical protein F5Y19DRAFT_471148 [Xylariaceae sp. FL1651]